MRVSHLLRPTGRVLRFAFLAGCLARTIVAADAASVAIPADPVSARLVPESAAIAPGTTLWVDLHLAMLPGWHTYWRNPGDSGLPTTIDWTLPPRLAAGDIAWPAPQRFVVGGFGNYGYADNADLLVPITAAADIAPGSTAHLTAEVRWLACAEICIPGEAKLALEVPVAATPAAPDPAAAPLFAAARARLPEPAKFAAGFAVNGQQLALLLPREALAGLERPSADFFPYRGNILDAAAEPRLARQADGAALQLARLNGPAAPSPQTLGQTLDGVLVLRGADGENRSYAIAAVPAAGAAPDDPTVNTLWWQAMLFALLGGVLLNLMPCVFPVLSLKLLSLTGAGDRAARRRHGLAYGAGVIVSFALLGGTLLALRAGGSAIGWGFQLQSPVVVGLLADLLLAMGLSLSGVAELGAGWAGIGGRLAARPGLAGAFATGVLATIVATPCTAPFMGAALGFALLAPAALALAVFVALGFGLAAPMAVASLVPGLARLLPRPGPWMAWFKQALAFPLYATVAWLVWIMVQEVGPEGAAAGLFGLVCVGFAMWIYGGTRLAGPAARHIGGGLAAAAGVAALALALMLTPAAPRPEDEAAAAKDGLPYEPFSPARLAALGAEHRPVFVNLTAAWCLTCLVNEHTALDSMAVRQVFAARHIAALKGDWTRQNPEITAFLQQFGRSGVPLYLLYDSSGRPTILPQLLTEGEVLSAAAKL